MSTIQTFPKCVSIRVTPSSPPGIAVRLQFHMKRKNCFNYIVFSDSNGTAEVKSDKLLAVFDEERSAFLMDYENPREVFSGKITAKILSAKELESALAAYEVFRGKVSFPSDYAEHLKAALRLGDRIGSHKVEVYA